MSQNQPTYQEMEASHTSGVYTKRAMTIVRGQGARLWDENGVEYIDCVGGQGAANLGHAHPKVAAAIAQQAATLILCPELFNNDKRALLSEKLSGLAPTPMRRVFLCNSGTEAVEGAIKFARFATKRTKIIASMRGFHGRTMGALSATWEKKYREPFEPLVPGFSHIPYNNLEKLKEVIDDQTAAVILEVVQGEGGVHPGSAEFLQGAQELCRQNGALFIVDEVQTGWGRTGRLFACQHHYLEPDLLCLAKSMAGGLPMGAVLIADRVPDLAPMIHGSTFGGNPLACAASLAAIGALIEEQLPQRAARLGAWFLDELKKIESPSIREVRGLGLMIGIEVKTKVAPYLAALGERKVLALAGGLTVIRLLPPLVIEEEDLKQALSVIKDVFAHDPANK